MSVTSVGLRGAQEALVHIRSDQGGGGTFPAFPDLWLSRDHLCLVTGRLVSRASSKEAVGRVLGAAAAYSHSRLGSSTVTCAHKILQVGHLSVHHSRLPGEQEEPGALGGPSPKPV